MEHGMETETETAWLEVGWRGCVFMCAAWQSGCVLCCTISNYAMAIK